MAVVGAVVPMVVNGLAHTVTEKEPAKCPGAGCGGASPGNCSVGAATYEPAENAAGLQVRYSLRCHAAWGRILRGEPGDVVTITESGGQAERGLIHVNHDAFTPMVTVTDSSVVQVCAEPTNVADRSGTWDRYCISRTGAQLRALAAQTEAKPTASSRKEPAT